MGRAHLGTVHDARIQWAPLLSHGSSSRIGFGHRRQTLPSGPLGNSQSNSWSFDQNSLTSRSAVGHLWSRPTARTNVSAAHSVELKNATRNHVLLRWPDRTSGATVIHTQTESALTSAGTAQQLGGSSVSATMVVVGARRIFSVGGKAKLLRGCHDIGGPHLSLIHI